MARILIAEPYPDVRDYLVIVIARLGHEAVAHDPNDPDFANVDLALIEPSDPVSFEAAKTLRSLGIPLIFESIYPPTETARAMQPAAYLIKPFARATLEQAIRDALESR